MKWKVRVSGLAATVLALGAFGADVAPGGVSGVASTFRLTASLNPQQIVPRPAGQLPGGEGTFRGTLIDRSPRRGHIAWTLTLRRLTSKPTSTYLYLGARGSVGRLAVIVCHPCQLTARGDAYVPPAVVRALEAGSAYVEVETKRHPAGEMRGQIRATRAKA